MPTRFDLLEKFAWHIAIGELNDKIHRGEFTCNRPASIKLRDIELTKRYVYIGTRPLLLEQCLTILNQPMDLWVSRNTSIVKDTVSKLHRWLLNSANIYLGLDQLPHVSAIDGNTQAFDLFLVRHRNKHIKILRGEWIYHVQQLSTNNFTWSYIEDAPLSRGDAVLISAPFSGLGEIHPNMLEIFQRCEQLDIPVLVDCCFSVVTKNLTYDLRSSAIENVTFSCSKIFPLQGLPAGIRFSKIEPNDFQTVKLKREYENRLNFAVLNKFLDIPQSEIIDDIKTRQQYWCQTFGLNPLAVGYLGLADQYLLEAHEYWSKIHTKARMEDYAPTISLVSLIENHQYFLDIQKKFCYV